jgi:hypothetical protein
LRVGYKNSNSGQELFILKETENPNNTHYLFIMHYHILPRKNSSKFRKRKIVLGLLDNPFGILPFTLAYV